MLKLGKFIKNAKLDLVYDLNVLQRKQLSPGTNKRGTAWDSTNSIALLKFLQKQAIPLYGLELGNGT